MGNNDGGCLGLIVQLLSIFCGGSNNNQQQQQQQQQQGQPPQQGQYGYPGTSAPTWGQQGQQQHGQQQYGQQQHGQQHSYPPQQQHQQHGQGQGGGDQATYQQWRNDARREGDLAHKCFADSQTAYKSGDGGRAHELSVEGKAHQAKQDALDDKAAAWIFNENNKTQPRGTIDLHGLYVKEAIEQVDRAIAEGQRGGLEELRVITGKGLHSAGGNAKIKPAVADLMRKYNLSAQVDPHNAGVLVVDLQGRGGGNRSRDAGGLVDQMKRGGDDDACTIM